LEKLIVRGPVSLQGKVRIGGSKNAALPVLAASLLGNSPSLLRNVPDLLDVRTMLSVLENVGARVERIDRHTYRVDSTSLCNCEPSYELIRKMRASFLITGPLLSRLGRAKVPLPGGCAIGSRPIDLHLKGFAHLGVEVLQSSGYVEARAGILRGREIYLDFPSVGATENLMMLAASIPGETLIINVAKEPEVVDLARFLTLMGAEIQGVGSDVILVKGKKNLQGVEYEIMNDRIEAGTFCVAAAITRGEVEIEGVDLSHIFPIVTKLEETGARVKKTGEKTLLVTMQKRPQAINIKTMPHPGFPTDMQAQFTALLCIAEGVSVVTETVFESRFAHVGELERMGANIQVEGRSVIVRGVEALNAAQVAASDLRAGAALVLAGLAAQGETEISGLFHIDRGYEAIEDKLNSLGAFIKRVKDVDRGNVDVE